MRLPDGTPPCLGDGVDGVTLRLAGVLRPVFKAQIPQLLRRRYACSAMLRSSLTDGYDGFTPRKSAVQNLITSSEHTLAKLSCCQISMNTQKGAVIAIPTVCTVKECK